MLEQKTVGAVGTVYFIALATMMYYFLTQILYLPVYVTFRHAFALLIVASAFVCFLIRPDLPRAAAAVKAGVVLSVPLLVMVTASLLLWCVERTDFDLISRGLSYHIIFFNQATAAFAAVSFLYVFGERGIWYNLIALLCANLLMIATIMLENGVGPYLRELWTLIRTFAGETGPIIQQAEIHELAFCLGAYLVYMLTRPRRSVPFLVLLALSGFCFLSAFKRIAMAAIAAAIGVGWLLRLLEKRGGGKLVRRAVHAAALALLLLLLAYVALVKLGAFSWMEEAGLDTMGRADAYEEVEDLYTLSPVFLGNGMGFLTYQISETDNLNLPMDTIHSDILQMYIDLGFWGFAVWLLSFTTLRVGYFGRRRWTEGAENAFVLVLFMLLVSTTDNTLNYPLVHTALDILVAGHGFDRRTQEERTRLTEAIARRNGSGTEWMSL